MCDWVIVNFCLVTSEGKLCLYDYKHEECTLKMYLLECLPNLALSLVEAAIRSFPWKFLTTSLYLHFFGKRIPWAMLSENLKQKV